MSHIKKTVALVILFYVKRPILEETERTKAMPTSKRPALSPLVVSHDIALTPFSPPPPLHSHHHPLQDDCQEELYNLTRIR